MTRVTTATVPACINVLAIVSSLVRASNLWSKVLPLGFLIALVPLLATGDTALKSINVVEAKR